MEECSDENVQAAGEVFDSPLRYEMLGQLSLTQWTCYCPCRTKSGETKLWLAVAEREEGNAYCRHQ